MDTLDLADGDFNKLYKLHGGYKLFEDSDGSSAISDSNELFDSNEPPLYTYEELQANLGEFDPDIEPVDRGQNTKGDVPKAEAKIAQDHQTTNIGLGAIRFECYLCNLSFWSRDVLLIHKTGFPHCPLYEMKADLVSQGIFSEYWLLRKKKIIHCILCDVFMQGSLPATDHLNSRGHRQLFEQWIKRQRIAKKVNRKFYCDICEFNLDGTSEIQFHYQGKIHLEQAAQHLSASEKNAKWFSDNAESDTIGKTIQDQLKWKETEPIFNCYACNLKFTSQKDLDSHCEEVLHKRVVKMKHLMVSKGISQAEYWELIDDLQLNCLLCKAILKHDSSVTSHFKSKRHEFKLLSWMALQTKDYSDPYRKWFLCDLCSVELDGTCNAENHYHQESHIRQAAKHVSASRENEGWFSDTVSDTIDKTSQHVILETELNHNKVFDCLVCNLKYTSQKDLDNHCGEAIHKNVVKLKQFIVSKGISQAEYWRWFNLQLNCMLCMVTLTNDSAIDSHFKSKKHVSRLITWMQRQTKDYMHSNYKWVCCDLCRTELDGTTNAEKHYRQESHIRRQIEIAYEESAKWWPDEIIPSRSIQPSLVAVKDEETLSLKDKVLTQMERLMDNVYFSKRVPLKIALNYIRKYNQELKSLQYNEKIVVS